MFNNLMNKAINLTLFLTMTSLFVNVQADQINDDLANQFVMAADTFRQAEDSMKIETHIALYKKGELSKSKDYEIYSRAGRKSLVLMKSNSEKGQKVLMLGDKFWMLLPKSRRPIRITPMQKLLGEASTGDIATLNWHEDYSATFLDTNQKDIDVLMLTSKRKGTSYKSIELTLEKVSHKPIKANLYVASGKLAKVASYQFGWLNGRQQVISMTLVDKINITKKTVITYKSMQPYQLDNKFYNPAYLAKKPNIK